MRALDHLGDDTGGLALARAPVSVSGSRALARATSAGTSARQNRAASLAATCIARSCASAASPPSIDTKARDARAVAGTAPSWPELDITA
jgi:hypothetical protein